MLSYEITVQCFWPGFKSCNKCVLGPNMGLMCVRGGWGGEVGHIIRIS